MKAHISFNPIDLIFDIFFYTWMFLMLVSSGKYTTEKTVLMLFLVLICLSENTVIRKNINRSYIVFCIAFIAYFIFSFLWGILLGYPTKESVTISLLKSYILTPISVLIIYSGFIGRNDRICHFNQFLRITTAEIVFIDWISFLNRVGLIPSIIFTDIINITSNDISSTLSYRISNDTSLMFLAPVFITSLFQNKERKMFEIYIDIFIAVFGFVRAFIGGRRMLEIIIFLSMSANILLLLIGRNVKSHNTHKKIGSELANIIVTLFTILLIFYIFYICNKNFGIIDFYKKMIENLVDVMSSESKSMGKRVNDFYYFMTEWYYSPFIGYGLTSHHSHSSAYDYEIFFVAILFKSGIVGLTFFTSLIYFILKGLYDGYRKTKNTIFICYFSGFLSFVICGATNPMLYFSWPWIIGLIFLEKVQIEVDTTC